MKLFDPPLIGQEAVRQFVSTLSPKAGSKELWIKMGHNSFFKTDFDFEVGYPSLLEEDGESTSRIFKAAKENFLSFIEAKAKQKEGGVFYIPSQPQGLPIKECVSVSDDLVFEMDDKSLEEQLEAIKRFCEITGLELSSLFTSGGKSLHGHIKLSEHIEIERVIYLNQLIAIALRSDPVVARPHQPTRIPGFYRKEKESYQELLYISHTRYEYEEVVERIKRFFDEDLLEFPEELPEDFWSNFIWKALKAKNLTLEERDKKLRKALIFGVDGWRAWEESNRIIRKQKQDLYESRKTGVKNLQGESIVDLVRQTCEDLEEKPFDIDEHEWQWSRGDTHARGKCLWHDSKSGNSAWLDARNGWTYHCPVCTNDKPLDALAYWQLGKYGEVQKDMSGLAWIKDAKEWLESHGVQVPELDINSLINFARKFPEAPELEIDEERSAEPGGWEEELEKAVRVYILQDRTSVKVRYAKKIKEHFGVSQCEIDKIAIDVNTFNREEPELVGNLVGGVVEKVQDISLGNSEAVVPSSLYGLNKYLPKGYYKTCKVVLGANSSTGKTAIALKEAYNIAKFTDEPVAFFSPESPTEQLIFRLLSNLTKIPLGRLFRGQLTEVDWSIFLSAADDLSSLKLYFDGTPNISTSQIRQKLMRLNDEVGYIRAVFVDHLSRVAQPYPGNENGSMTAISNDLSNIVNELKCTGFWLSQINRAPNARQTKEPEVNDLRSSKAVEQDADLILMPYRPGMNNDKIDPELMELYIRKNRDGPLGSVKLRFRGEYMEIEDGENYEFDNQVDEVEDESTPDDVKVNYF